MFDIVWPSIFSTFSAFFSISFKSYIHQGASIKNLEAGSNGNGHVAGVKLGDGSIVEADTVKKNSIFFDMWLYCNYFLVENLL